MFILVLLNVVPIAIGAVLIRGIRPRWLGLTSGLALVGLTALVMGSLLFTVKAGYGIAPSLWDVWPAAPSVLAIIVLPMVPTRSSPTGRGCCECGYSLEGNSSGVCPECGKQVRDEVASKPVR